MLKWRGRELKKQLKSALAVVTSVADQKELAAMISAKTNLNQAILSSVDQDGFWDFRYQKVFFRRPKDVIGANT